MPEQIIDIPPNTEVVITIAINPYSKYDAPDPVEPIPIPVIEPDPVVEPVPIPVVEPVPVIEPNPIPAIEPDPAVEPVPIPVTEPEPVPVVEPDPIPVIEPIPVVEPNPTPATEPQNDPPVVNTSPEVEPTPIAETPPVTPDPVVTTEPIPIVEVPEVSPPITPEVPPVETIPIVIPPVQEPLPPVIPPVIIPLQSSCDCKLTSTLSLAEFTKQLIAATKDLFYPSESDFPIEVLSKGVNTRMPSIKGIEVRTLDRVFPYFLRQVDPDDQQTGNIERANTAARWQALYELIEKHTVTTAWHYPVKQKRYTHEMLVVMLHPQGAIGLRIRLVET